MRKEVRNNYIFLLGFVFLLSIGLVAAQQGAGGGQSPLSDLGGLVETVFQKVKPVLETAFGAPMNIDPNAPVSSDYIARIMFFTIIFALLWITLSKIDFIAENTFILWVVVIAASFLSTRWLSGEMGGTLVQTLLLPYDALGLSLAGFLPLIVYFVFLDIGFSGRKYRTIRKSGWIFFFVIFVFLWITRASELVTAASKYAGMIYPVSAGLCLVFFLADRTIQTYYHKMKGDEALARGRAKIINNYADEIDDIHNKMSVGGAGIANYTRRFPRAGAHPANGLDAAKADVKWLSDEIAKLKS